MKNLLDRYRSVIFLAASALIAAGAMVYFFVNAGFFPFGQSSVLITDMSQQYIDYFAGYHEILTGGKDLLYTWNTGMGMNLLGIIAYYLSSPFTLIILLFPKAMIVEAVMAMSVVKTAACAVTFFLLLKRLRHGKTRVTDIAFSVMYALIAYNILYFYNIMWIDGVIFLPLILMGVEDIIEKKKFTLFTISLAIMFISNFYISFMVGIFVFMWFVLSFFRKKDKDVKKSLILFFSCTAIAAGIAAIILIPSFFSLTAAYGDSGAAAWTGRIHTTPQTLFLRMLPFSADNSRTSGSAHIFSGTLVLLLIPLYFFNKKISSKEKSAAACLFLVFFISFIFWDISNIWHVFRAPTWFNFRFSFTYSCFAILISWRAFENLDGVSKIPALLTAPALFALMIWSKKGGEISYSISNKYFYYIAAFIAIYALFIFIFSLKMQKLVRLLTVFLVLFVCFEMIYNGSYLIKIIPRDFGGSDSAQEYTETSNLLSQVNEVINASEGESDLFFRSENRKMRWSNDNLANGYNGIAHYSSLSNRAAFRFMGSLGMLCCTNDRYLRYFGSTNVIDDLFSVKYITSVSEPVREYKKLSSLDGAVVSLNENALPLAYFSQPEVLDYTPFRENVFINQNNLISALLGEETNVFLPVEPFYFEAVDMEYDSELTNYNVSGSSPKFLIKIKAERSGQFYMRFTSTFDEHNRIKVNGELIGRARDDYLRGTVPLGYFEAGEDITVEIPVTLNRSGELSSLYISVLDEELLNASIDRLAETSSGFTADGRVVTGRIDAPNDGMVFTTIPYDEGWKAYIDGKRTDISSVDGAFIALPVSSGGHDVILKYTPKGFTPGLIISILSVLIFTALIFRRKVLQLCRAFLWMMNHRRTSM